MNILSKIILINALQKACLLLGNITNKGGSFNPKQVVLAPVYERYRH